jgi:Spy/CpxP family protein refolding chaperone
MKVTQASAGAAARASKAKAVLGALSLLVLGAVLGIAIDRHVLSGGHRSAAATFHDMTMSSLEERLALTAQQRLQIESIVAARHNTLRHAWQIMHEQLGAAVDTVHQEIEAVLTPEQRTDFREWLRGVRRQP